MEIYFHQTFQLKQHNLMESKHFNSMFQVVLNAPFLLLLIALFYEV